MTPGKRKTRARRKAKALGALDERDLIVAWLRVMQGADSQLAQRIENGEHRMQEDQ